MRNNFEKHIGIFAKNNIRICFLDLLLSPDNSVSLFCLYYNGNLLSYAFNLEIIARAAEVLDLCLAHMSEDGVDRKYVQEAFDTNWVVPIGPNVNGFERDLEGFVSSKQLDRKVVCLSAGTAAVHLALILFLLFGKI